MKYWALALALIATPASATDGLFALYASGQYDAAMREGAAAGTAEGFAIAARAALADAAMRGRPCLECLQRAEDFARRAVAAGAAQADGHVWLAAVLGLEGRLTGVVRAQLSNSPQEAKAQLDLALRDDPHNAYALAAMGGWNIEIAHVGGAYLAQHLYGAGEADGLSFFDRAEKSAPGNVAIHYQVALSLAGYKPDQFRARILDELMAAQQDTPQTAYEKFVQGRAADLSALLKKNDAAGFAQKVRIYQGYP
jgi:hypothetical protein